MQFYYVSSYVLSYIMFASIPCSRQRVHLTSIVYLLYVKWNEDRFLCKYSIHFWRSFNSSFIHSLKSEERPSNQDFIDSTLHSQRNNGEWIMNYVTLIPSWQIVTKSRKLKADCSMSLQYFLPRNCLFTKGLDKL